MLYCLISAVRGTMCKAYYRREWPSTRISELREGLTRGDIGVEKRIIIHQMAKGGGHGDVGMSI